MTELKAINKAVQHNPAQLIAEDNKKYFEQIKSLTDSLDAKAGKHTIIMLAGPSGSGKTTTAHKIAEELKNKGIEAITISLDNFYLGQGRAPKHEDGSFDYETVHALDLPLVHETFLSLIETGKCCMPRFDFMVGARAPESTPIELTHNGVAIVEGIHAMNPLIVDSLPKENLRTVYISVRNGIFDGETQILTPRSLRLIRRMVRDSIFRNSSPSNTLDMWVSVIKGEAVYLSPYKHKADISINSFHSCEPSVFRDEVIRLCSTVTEDDPGYQTARTLIAGIRPFVQMSESHVPADSLLREFIGGGIY